MSAIGVCSLQGKQIATFPIGIPGHAATPKDLLDHTGTITMWKWNTGLHSDCYRKLVNESRDVFIRLQDDMKSSEGGSHKSKILTASRSYRALAQVCILDMEQCSGDSDEANAEMKLLAAQQLLWALAETVFLLTPQKGYAVPSLLSVIQQHFPPADHMTDDVTNRGSRSPHYENVLMHLLSQGQIDEARRVLALHEHASSSEFHEIDTLLKRMPVFAKLSGHQAHEFESRWRYWQTNVRQKVGVFKHPLTVSVSKLISGDEASLHRLCDERVLYHWLMLLGAQLYWNISPASGIADIAPAAQIAMGTLGEQSTVDTLLLASLQLDLPLILKDSSEVLNSWWFPAHFIDLCQHADVLQPQTPLGGIDLREFLIVEYASCFLHHSSLWAVAIDYFSKCPVNGIHLMQQSIERVSPDSECKALKLLSVCRKHQLPEAAHHVCRVMSRRAALDGKLGSALNWALKGKDAALAGHYADIVLSNYTSLGEFSIVDVLDNLSGSALISESATFLSMYRKFHMLYGSGELSEAADLLLHLLSSDIAPKRFWMTLLRDALPLLEGSQMYFDAAATYELMDALEQISLDAVTKDTGISPADEELVMKTDDDQTTQTEGLVRLALERNLSRALLVQTI